MHKLRAHHGGQTNQNQSVVSNYQLRMHKLRAHHGSQTNQNQSYILCFRAQVAIISPTKNRMSYHLDFCLISGQFDVGFNSEFFQDFRAVFPKPSIEFNAIPDWENTVFFFHTFKKFADRTRALDKI